MSNTFGYMYIQGLQINLPGQQSVGPYSIPASGLQDTITVSLANSTVITGIPSETNPSLTTSVNPSGVLVIPSASNTVAFTVSFTSNAAGYFNVNPAYPSFISLDPNNMPYNIYLKSAGTLQVVLQFI